MVKYYKLLSAAGVGVLSGKPWMLPTSDEPGPWMPKIDNIELCRSGYHACEFKNVLDWADEVMWEVELRGEIITGDNKVVAQEARSAYAAFLAEGNGTPAENAAFRRLERVLLPDGVTGIK